MRFADGSESRFGTSYESERKYHPGSSSSDRSSDDGGGCPGRTKGSYAKVKGASKQKQLEDDDLEVDTRVYGKSPKFDDNLSGFIHMRGESGAYDCRGANRRAKIAGGNGGDLLTHERRFYDGGGADDDDVSFNESEEPASAGSARRSDGVVFNTLDGFENESAGEPYRRENARERAYMNLDVSLENRETASGRYARSSNNDDDHADDPRRARTEQQDYLRKNEERKFSAGQIKRPLSQDEDVSTKSGRVLESPEVTPGDVGRMLNLGNALDGPRQAQANKYLSLVTLHLPVILRLSVNCPFQNVRIKCAEILEMVKVSGKARGCTRRLHKRRAYRVSLRDARRARTNVRRFAHTRINGADNFVFLFFFFFQNGAYSVSLLSPLLKNIDARKWRSSNNANSFADTRDDE